MLLIDTPPINWILLLIMMLYGFFNGVGSFFYKLGLKKITDQRVNFLDWSKFNVKGFFQLLKTPIWVLGAIFLAIDFVIYQIAIQRYELSVVKPLVNLNLIFVIFFGIFAMKENIRLREWIGVVLIFLGAISLTAYSEETLTILDGQAAGVFFAVVGIIVVLFMLIVRISQKEMKLSFEFFVSITCGLLFGLGSICNKAIYSENITPVLWWTFMGGFLLTYCTAFFYGQAAYLRCRMSITSTLVNIISILIPFIGGLLIFHEPLIITSETSIFRYVKIMGLLLILVGVSLNYSTQSSEIGKN